MKKSDIKALPAYFDRYINLAEDVPLQESLQISLKELEQAPIEIWNKLGDKTYAPGKWTVKDILQHMIDTERVFVYRITAIARGDKQKMIPYDEQAFAENTTAGIRTVEDLLEEAILVRKGTIAMFRSFNSEMLHRSGRGYGNVRYCPLSLGFMIAGHQRWHFRVLEDNYYALITG